jgi:hypothetical protein
MILLHDEQIEIAREVFLFAGILLRYSARHGRGPYLGGSHTYTPLQKNCYELFPFFGFLVDKEPYTGSSKPINSAPTIEFKFNQETPTSQFTTEMTGRQTTINRKKRCRGHCLPTNTKEQRI